MFTVDPVLELRNLKGEPSEKKGVKYIAVKNIELKVLKVGKIILQLDNLFQGNAELSKYKFSFKNSCPNFLLRVPILKVIYEIRSFLQAKI